jgi:hypothetical protein
MQPLGYLATLLMVMLSVGLVQIVTTPRMNVGKLPRAQLVVAGASSPLASRPPLLIEHLVRGLVLFVVGAGGLALLYM